MDEKLKAVRSKVKDGSDLCFKCKKQFKDNEIISLVCLKNTGNKLFCVDCAESLM